MAIDWRFAEPERGELSLETIDAIYCEGLARGIRPIFHITGTPEWAADEGGCPLVSCLYPPTEAAVDDLRDFAATVAERYPRAAAIEAWNEPNLATYWAVPNPKRYVEVLTAIDDGVKSTGSPIPVLGGSLSNTGQNDESRSRLRPVPAPHAQGGCGRAHGRPRLPPLPDRAARVRGQPLRARRWLACAGRCAPAAPAASRSGSPKSGCRWAAHRQRGPGADDGRESTSGSRTEPDVVAVIFHTLLEGESEAGSGDGFGWVVPTEAGIELRPVYEHFADPDR